MIAFKVRIRNFSSFRDTCGKKEANKLPNRFVDYRGVYHKHRMSRLGIFGKTRKFFMVRELATWYQNLCLLVAQYSN